MKIKMLIQSKMLMRVKSDYGNNFSDSLNLNGINNLLNIAKRQFLN